MMTPIEFLRAVWPADGYYAIATPWTPPGAKTAVYVHKVFDTVEAAAQFAETHKNRTDIFFCVHSLRETKVWNDTKPDHKTGELGAWEVRTQTNMLAGRAFILDIDVGESTERVLKYASREEAFIALRTFCKETSLPKPIISSSGGGLHIYWPIDEALPSKEWRQHANKLQQLVRFHGLRADPARTTDSASVLRVPGTFNLKDRDNPRPVKVIAQGATSPTLRFIKMLDDALVHAGVDARPLPDFSKSSSPLGSNLDMEFNGPPVSMKALITACPQMQRMARLKGNVTEPEWYQTLNLVRFTQNGRANAHKISEGHPEYSYDLTEKKLAQLEQRNLGPTSCFKMADVAGDSPCATCSYQGRVKSPLVAARFKDTVPPPIVQQMVGSVMQQITVPPAPVPFSRTQMGVIYRAKKGDGDVSESVILPHDLYPIGRLINEASETEQLIWRADLPTPTGVKPVDFTLDADALYDTNKFSKAVSNRGIYPRLGDVKMVQDYMTAYIAQLQKLTEANAQRNHLGWIDDRTAFVLPDKTIYADGSVKASSLSLGATRASASVKKKGTLQRQVELLRFYTHPAYVANQFFILCGLAAPLFHATGHHGVIVNATGDPGASKSTSLYTAASFWGEPELYALNGTNQGATIKARNERLSTLANLPVCVDEVTHMPDEDVIDLAMGVTQPGYRVRLDTAGVERAGSGGYKATMMLTTANSSLHNALSRKNAAGTAGSMRVFEIAFKAMAVHSKPEADEYWAELKENYGHIGEEVVAYVVRNHAAVIAAIRAEMKAIDIEAKIRSAERFWSATVAPVIVIGRIAKELGLLMFDIDFIRDWVLRKQIPYMRGTVVDSYATPQSTLADYLNVISGDMLVIDPSFQNSTIKNVRLHPRSQLLAHYETGTQELWVLLKGFRDYCARSGANHRQIIEELTAEKIIREPHARKVLGAGTEWAKAQSRCFLIDMSHPEMSGALDLPRTAPAGSDTKLRLVK